MNSTSFGSENSGTQVGTNRGLITQIYISYGERQYKGFIKLGRVDLKLLLRPRPTGDPRAECRQWFASPLASQTGVLLITVTEILELLVFP